MNIIQYTFAKQTWACLPAVITNQKTEIWQRNLYVSKECGKLVK